MPRLVKRIKVCVCGHTQAYMCKKIYQQNGLWCFCRGLWSFEDNVQAGSVSYQHWHQDSSVPHDRTLLIQAAEDFSSPSSKCGCLLAAHSFRLLATFLIASCKALGRWEEKKKKEKENKKKHQRILYIRDVILKTRKQNFPLGDAQEASLYVKAALKF